jgi:hypothetical protein
MVHLKSLNHSVIRQWVTLVAIILAFVVNVASNIVPPNGQTIGEVSATQFGNVLITPANYAFIIWGLIYIGLFALGGYQVRAAQRSNPRLQRGGYGLAIACAIQIAWVFLFLTYQFVLSLMAMVGILLALIWFYTQIRAGQETPSRGDRWFIILPTSIYLGWISVATVVNVACALTSINWSGWGISPEAWTVILMLITMAIALVVIAQRADVAFTGVIIWALVAIAIRQADVLSITATGIGAAIVLAIGVGIRKAMNKPA